MSLIIRVDSPRDEDRPGINGTRMFLELDGEMVPHQIGMNISAEHEKAATCTVTFIMPNIKYKDE